jgi:hypothetical protein
MSFIPFNVGINPEFEAVKMNWFDVALTLANAKQKLIFRRVRIAEFASKLFIVFRDA